MRFSLQDVKRQVRRRDGELALTLHFLRPGELRAEIARLVAYYEQHCGLARQQFAQDEARALIGDYRPAGCLLPVLSAWYSWQTPAWDEAVDAQAERVASTETGEQVVSAQVGGSGRTAQTREKLVEAGLNSPTTLRLALFDFVNANYAGFLDTSKRSQVLAAFAADYGLDAAGLEVLLALDSEDAQVLTRVSAESPDAEAVAGLYNQWVFEAALFNASEARFTIDCAAFLDAQREQTGAGGTLTGLGAVIKRLCFLARKLGVYYDLAYEEVATIDAPTTFLHLTLYGPQEMSGSPQQYGQRLARLCRLLLGYGVSAATRAGTTSKRQGSVALSKALRQAEATVYLFQQPYRFSMDAGLLALLPVANGERATARVVETAAIYDSSIEQSFAEAFAALERAQGTDGWQLEREPEPLLLPADAGESSAGIVIPDFALTRGSRRIYVEILGFWTPAYRERKVQKLWQLRGRADLILALPVEARPAFAALAEDYPMLEYRGQLSASDLLRIMQARYDDFAERLANLDRERVRMVVRTERFVPERACYELLSCYRRAELAKAAVHVLAADDMAYTPGIGVYLLAWLEHLHRSFVEWVEAQNRSTWPLSALIQECMVRWSELADCDDATIEALLARWPEVEIRRESIFEATLFVTALCAGATVPATMNDEAVSGEIAPPVARKVVRERRVKEKKTVPQETSQQNLWE